MSDKNYTCIFLEEQDSLYSPLTLTHFFARRQMQLKIAAAINSLHELASQSFPRQYKHDDLAQLHCSDAGAVIVVTILFLILRQPHALYNFNFFC